MDERSGTGTQHEDRLVRWSRLLGLCILVLWALAAAMWLAGFVSQGAMAVSILSRVFAVLCITNLLIRVMLKFRYGISVGVLSYLGWLTGFAAAITLHGVTYLAETLLIR
ncbi:MAG: hypothetical protein QHH01_01465 [Spirochaetales bacterium]|nr:hypothetical protein [Spirochaetales bacterium]